jgi:hypothetical protein
MTQDDHALRQEMDRVLRVGRLIVLAMVLGISAFAVVATVLQAGGAVEEGLVPPGILPLVAGAVLILLFTAPIVRRAVWESAQPAVEELPQRWLTALIVASAVREGAGLLGIVLGMLAGSSFWIIALGGAAVAAMALTFPRGEELESEIRRRGGAPLRPAPGLALPPRR